MKKILKISGLLVLIIGIVMLIFLIPLTLLSMVVP
jgi:hypothetical protein